MFLMVTAVLHLLKNGIQNYKKNFKKEALKEENVVEVHDLSNIEEVIGEKGTAAVFDANITHKAGQVLK